MSINTGNKILDATIKSLQKGLGKEDVFSLGPGFESATPIPTGSVALDMAIGIGGIPMGRVIEIYGPESSGKTSLSLRIMKSWFDHRDEIGQGHRKALFIDLEHVTGADMLVAMGIPLEEVIWFPAESTEQALNALADLVKTEQIGIVILDSVDALQSEEELKKKIGQESMGGTGKHMSKHLREMSKVAFNTDTTLIYINQIRASMALLGSSITTPGGNALKFYASLRLQTMPRQDSNVRGAFKMRVKIIKNKVAPPRKDPVEFDFLYARGPEPYNDLITAAKEIGVIRFAGPTSFVKWYDTDTEERLATGGANGILAAFDETPELFTRLRASVLKAGGVPDDSTNSDGDDTSDSDSEE